MADFSPVLGSFRNIFHIPDLRKRVLFMLGLLAAYRVGSWIPTPGVDSGALELVFNQQAGTVLGFLDMFSGGNLSRFSIFALGITPLHHRVHHPAVADGGLALPGAALQGR